MNIAIFTDFYLPSVGGVQTSILHQKRALERHGHTVWVFAPCYKGDVPFSEKEGIVRLPSSPLFSFDGHRGFIGFWLRRRVERIIRDKKIDIIHAQTEFTVGHFGLKIARSLGVPSVYTTHTLLWQQVYLLHKNPVFWTVVTMVIYMGYWRQALPAVERFEGERWAEWQWRRLLLFTAQHADAVVSPSSHLRDKYREWGFDGTIKVVSNFTDFAASPSAPLPATPTFLWVARFSPEKRPLEFIEAVRTLSRKNTRPFKVIMCGSGPLKSRCEAAAADLAAVSLKAALPYADMPKLYDTASALVVTAYRFENQPMVIAEALARGRGVIYCDPDLTADGLGGGAGLLIGASPQEMAAGLCSVIENPAKLDRMAKMSKKAAAGFGERQYLQKITELYTSLTRNR